MLNDSECKLPCETCEHLVYENIHYEEHVIRYLKSKCEIDNLPMGKVLFGNLEKVGWVVLKCDYAITPNSSEQNHLYHLNNKSYKKMNTDGIVFIKQIIKCFTISMNISNEDRFIDEDDIRNKVSIIFQSDCDVINQHLNEKYNFDIINNKYK